MIHKIIIPTPFAVGDVNAYLIKGDLLTLIDAGPKTEQAISAIKKGINEAGYELSDIEQVILTHHHPDHSGWIEAFEKANILGHEYNRVWLDKDQSFLDYHDEFYFKCLVEEGVPEHYLNWIEKMRRPLNYIGNRSLDTVLKEGDLIPGHPNLKVLETLGHAQSHISLWEEKEGVLIGGDLILEKISSNPLIEPPLDKNNHRPKSMLQYNTALKRVQALGVQKVYSGHGKEVFGVAELISSRLVKQRDRALSVHEMLKDGEKTIFELTKMLFPKVFEKELGLTLSETIGQIDYLMDEGLITEKRTDKGILLYEQA